MNDAVSYLEGGKMSVNLTQYEKTLDKKRVGLSFDAAANNDEASQHKKPPRVTEKMSYQK